MGAQSRIRSNRIHLALLITLWWLAGLAPEAMATTVYTVGNSNVVPSNSVNFSQDVLSTGSGSTITGAKLTAVFHPGQTSQGNPIPLLAGYVWLELVRTTSSDTQTMRLFDFPAAYPSPIGSPSGSVFDHSDIRVELNGSYLLDDGAVTDLHTAAVAAAGGSGITTPPAAPYPLLTPGSYSPSVDSLSALIGRDTDATYRVRAASLWSGTRGSVDWQLELITVPEPSSALLVSLGLVLLGTAKKGHTQRG